MSRKIIFGMVVSFCLVLVGANAWAQFGNTSYMRDIVIGNPGGEQLTDYQIVVNLDTAALIDRGVMKPDCGDIRFYDNNAQTELSYWIESGLNTSNTKVWVKVPIIPEGGTTIYLAYGNNELASQSNGDATFIFFDDFTGNSVDIDKWIVYTTPDTSITVNDRREKGTLVQKQLDDVMQKAIEGDHATTRTTGRPRGSASYHWARDRADADIQNR